MAFKANASSNGGGEFKQFVGVGSFRVLGVNPTKEELEKFYGREMQNEPKYLEEKKDDEGKAYKQLRVSFMIQADPTDNEGKPVKGNEKLAEPLKTTINFFLRSEYYFNKDKTKVQVIDKYGRTAWPTVDQAKNHQVPVYSSGPANIDKDSYRPALRGEESLTEFIRNYLNVTPIETYNTNTGQWVTNSNPEDCECRIDDIQKFFTGDISQLKEVCTLLPDNRLKLLVGVRTDNEGRQFMTVYTGATLRNGAKEPYKHLKDSVEGQKANGGLSDTIFSDDHAGLLSNIHEYKADVKETDLSKPVDDPFASGTDDLPFEESTDADPFADMAS